MSANLWHVNKNTQRQWAKDWVSNTHPDIKNNLDQQISKVVESFFLYLLTQYSSPLVVGAYQPLKDEVVWNLDLSIPRQIEIVYPQMLPQKLLKYEKPPSVILVPGLMFSPTGDRLGRGGGYFDRFLPEFLGLTMGINYKARVGEVAVEDHDYGVQGLITETGYKIFN